MEYEFKERLSKLCLEIKEDKEDFNMAFEGEKRLDKRCEAFEEMFFWCYGYC